LCQVGTVVRDESIKAYVAVINIINSLLFSLCYLFLEYRQENYQTGKIFLNKNFMHRGSIKFFCCNEAGKN
jgi:hypothetical protein